MCWKALASFILHPPIPITLFSSTPPGSLEAVIKTANSPPPLSAGLIHGSWQTQFPLGTH